MVTGALYSEGSSWVKAVRGGLLGLGRVGAGVLSAGGQVVLAFWCGVGSAGLLCGLREEFTAGGRR